LQIRARTRSLNAAEVERARIEERSILRTWLMRMTVHLIPAEDYGWMSPLFADRILAWSRRRLATLGVSEDLARRALDAAARGLVENGPMRRSEMMEVAAGVGVEPNVQRRTHLSVQLVVEGHACIGPDAERESTFVARRDWIGEPRPHDREASLAELARRYFSAFAPASERDFSYWSGLPLGECRTGMKRIAGDLVEVDSAGERLLAPKGWVARRGRSPSARLLGAFDTYLLGYRRRGHAVDEEDWERRILPGGGVLRPTICLDGRLVGLWSSKRSGSRLTVEIEPFAPLGDEVMELLRAEVADVGRFEGAEAELR
jgi:Winged helix DNA-binding domain